MSEYGDLDPLDPIEQFRAVTDDELDYLALCEDLVPGEAEELLGVGPGSLGHLIA